jgi:hypothetical protein
MISLRFFLWLLGKVVGIAFWILLADEELKEGIRT